MADERTIAIAKAYRAARQAGDIDRARRYAQALRKLSETNPDTGAATRRQARETALARSAQERRALKDMSYAEIADNVVRQAAKGASLGFSDEIAAGGDAVLSEIGERIGVTPERDFSERYAENVEEERAKDRWFEEIAPGWSTTGQIVGTGMTALGSGAAGAVARGGNLVTQALKGGAIGGVAGGVAGFGTGEGAEDRLDRATTGARDGMIAGVAAPALVAGAGAATRGVRNLINRDPARIAQTEVRKALIRDGLIDPRGDVRAQALELANRVRGRGEDAVLADAGENTRDLLGSVARMPGRTKEKARLFLSSRDARINEELGDVAEATLAGGRRFKKAKDDLIQMRVKDAKPFYERTVRPENVIPDEAIGGLLDDPFMVQTVGAVKRDRLANMANLPNGSMPVLDATYKRLEDMIGVSVRQGKGNRVRQLQQRLEKLRGAMDNAFPEYRLAREAWRGPKMSEEALDRGRAFVRGDSEMLADDIARMSEADREFFRVGVARELKSMLGRGAAGESQVRRLLKGDTGEKLALAFPDMRTYTRFRQKLSDGLDKFRTSKAVYGGSPTQPRQAAAADLGSVALDVATGQPPARGALSVAQRLWSRADVPESARDEIGRILLAPAGPGGADARILALGNALERRSGALAREGGLGKGVAYTAGALGGLSQ